MNTFSQAQNPSQRPASRSARVALLSASALLAASCSSDDDGGGTPPVPNTSTAFTSSLDRGQTVNNATRGAAVRVTVRNQAPSLGTFQTPVWLGVHDGTFDIYDSGVAASAELESLAEDGSAAALGTAFDTAAVGAAATTVGGVFGPADGPISPSESASTTFRLDPTAAESRYLSWASMVIPSNDAFIANGDPLAHELFDGAGMFVGTGFTVLGSEVLDAGTEDNDEVPANTAFFGQAAPNTGTTTVAGVIGDHPGFMAAGMGGILDDAMFANADFEAVGYTVLDVTVEDASASIAEPAGTAIATVDEATMMLTLELAASGLSGPATMLHLHQGGAGSTGGVIVDLFALIDENSGGTVTARGDVMITASDLAAMRAGNVYFNLHTDLNPGGEIRGQVGANNAATAALNTASNVTPPINGEVLRVTVQNLAPEMGTFQTPIWFGLHDGTFDMFDLAAAASVALERIAEDGNAAPLGDALALAGTGLTSGVIAGPDGPLAPGDIGQTMVRVNPAGTTNTHLSWASMVLPSNDAFIGNADPLAHEIYSGGTFSGAGFTVAAADALDAGTEVNDEIPANTAFFGQSAPDTGVDEGGTVGAHPGFLAAGMGGILDDAMYANADFANTVGYEFLRVNLAAVPASAVSPTGTASVRVTGGSANVRINAINLSGPATAVTLRNGAAGVDGAVLADVTGDIVTNADGSLSVSGPISVDSTFTDALAAGEVYVQVETALNPTGELRGQVTEAAPAL